MDDSAKRLRLMQLKMNMDADRAKLSETEAELQEIVKEFTECDVRKSAENAAGLISNATLVAFRAARDKLVDIHTRHEEHRKKLAQEIDELFLLTMDE